MKKTNCKILVIMLLVAVMSAGFLVRVFQPKPQTFYADEVASIIIAGSGYSGADENNFTPFDFEAGARMPGKSISPASNADNSFEKTFDFSASVDDIKDYELGLWVYYSTPQMHNLKFSFVGEIGGASANINYLINSDDQKSLLVKQGGDFKNFVEGDGYGWNYFQIPLKEFSSETTNFDFSSLKISYESEATDVDFSTLFLYNIALNPVTVSQTVVLEQNKQPFRFCEFKFYDTLVLQEVYVGDTLSLQSQSTELEYAWVGQTNIKAEIDSHNPNYLVSAYVDEEQWEFSAPFTFSTAGKKIVRFVIADKAHSDEEILWQAHILTINNFVGLTFNQNIAKFNIGETIRFFVTANSKLQTLNDLNFEVVGDCATIVEQNATGKYVDVKMNKAGTFELKATATGSRLLDSEIDLVATKQITVKKAKKDKTQTTKILLYVALGLIVLAGVISGIKAIINANKYKVR